MANTFQHLALMLRTYGYRFTFKQLMAKFYNRFIASRTASASSWRTIGSFPTRTSVRGRPIRVVFFLESPESWDSFASVWKAMQGDNQRFDPVVVCLKNYPQTVPEPMTRLTEESVPFVTQSFYSLDCHKPDVAFFHKQYDNNKHAHFRASYVLRKTPRLAFISYGFPIGGGPMRIVSQFNYPLQQFAWRVYVHSNVFKALFGRYCSAGNHHVRVVGHPMVDALMEMNENTADKEMAKWCSSRIPILWNPHYCETANHDDCSTFLRWKTLLMGEFQKRKTMALIVRPHPRLFSHLVRYGLMTDGEIRSFVKRIEESDNMLLDQRSDYRHAFFVSRALMSDVSSFLTLYPATGKPVLYLRNAKGPGLNENGGIVRGFYNGESAEEISAFLDMIERNEDPLRDKRNNLLREYLHMPSEGAGKVIAEDVFLSVSEGR